MHIRGFKQARETEYPPIAGMDENTITYLLTMHWNPLWKDR